MRMKWSRQVDELTLKSLISVHRHRSELNMKIALKKRNTFSRKRGKLIKIGVLQ